MVRLVSKNWVSVSFVGEKKFVCRLFGNKLLEFRLDGCF